MPSSIPARPLLTADEVRTLPHSRQILFGTGQRPVLAKKLRYFADPGFKGGVDPPWW